MRPSRIVTICSVLAPISALLVGAAAPAWAAVRDPVVIVPGTFFGPATADVGYGVLAGRLRADGYSVHMYPQPSSGMGDIADNAADLARYVERVRAETGAAKVDLVTHSQGGIVARYFVKNLGGAAEVDDLINLSAPNYGTYVGNLLGVTGDVTCTTPCRQMAVGSAFLNALNAGDDTIGDVTYTNFTSVEDQAIQPPTDGFLHADGNNTNVLIQSQCPGRVVDHMGMVFDGTVYSGIRKALEKQPIGLDCAAL